MWLFLSLCILQKKKKKLIIIREILTKLKGEPKMKYQVIGAMKAPFTSKKNQKQYMSICVAQKDINWIGVKAEPILLSEDVLKDADIQTENGEMFAYDGKKYMVDIDYNNRGFIVGLRFYND